MFRTLMISLDSDDAAVQPARAQPVDDHAARQLAILRRLQAGYISAEGAARLLTQLSSMHRHEAKGILK